MSIVQAALPLWGLEDAEVTLIAARENIVYRVDHPSGRFAVRLHRVGYRTDEHLTAELDWMAWVAHSGLSVPAPLPSRSGLHLQIVEGVQVDVLNWLSGDTLDTVLPKADADTRARIFYSLGRDMARLHIASDAWPGAADCARPAWDADGLIGDAPLWGRFWENPGLSASQRALLTSFRTKAADALRSVSPTLDYGLIHADLVPGNVMADQGSLHFIDFDDGGCGYRLFELATALLKHYQLPEFNILKSAMIEGYRKERPLDTTHFDLFIALRAMTYVGWNITRMNEDQTATRNARFIAQAVDQAAAYLD